MYATFKNLDITLPRSSNDMAKIGKKLEPNEIQKGDLIFFKTNGKRVINHVGLVTLISSNHIMFIHASTSKGIREDDLFQNYWAQAYAKAIRPFRRLN